MIRLLNLDFKKHFLLSMMVIGVFSVCVQAAAPATGATRGAIKIAAWMGIVFNLVICAAILYLPTLLGIRWDGLLFMRPDIGIPLLSIAALIGALGLFKTV